MEEMSRCIHCTRCVRFGQEVAGVMELGMSHRGEHAEIETFLGQSIDSELSGNMIDICPVGALTSKPFRYSARTWEMSRRKSISPHDSTGANLIVQVKNHKVLRVVPFENEAVNECWISDRDRFSYEALNGPDRLEQPMIKQGGAWKTVDWQTALEYVANGFAQIKTDFGSNAIGALVSPHSTVEELYLANELIRGLGSDNIDHRLRHAEFESSGAARWLGMPIAALSELDRVLVIGAQLRKDHPLFAQRIRQATRRGAKVFELNEFDADWAMPKAAGVYHPAAQWVNALLKIAAAVAHEAGVQPLQAAEFSDEHRVIAAQLFTGQKKALLLGNAAAHHGAASDLLVVAQWIAAQTGAVVGYLTEAANTVGAQLLQVQPREQGLHAQHIAQGGVKAVMLLNVEPAHDVANPTLAVKGVASAQMVVSLSPFKANMDICDVMLPIAPFTETSGSFVNAAGVLQSFHAAVKPLGETRPAWKVLRVLADLLGVAGLNFESSAEVLKRALPDCQAGQQVTSSQLSNQAATNGLRNVNVVAQPCVASIYQLDGLVRRAPSLQQTADALLAVKSKEAVVVL
jgi:NADH-quinone oxidoreductase subunit G